MPRKFIQLFLVALFAVGLLALTQITRAQSVTPAANPTPAPLARPDYNYSESNGCTSCHFSRGAGGDHMPEAVGVRFDDATAAFVFTGRGWGHGVGMCQVGAYGLAKEGYSFSAILQKYYTGIKLQKMY